ncbi:hypothetical protein EDB85DRAFT_2181672 [Lactarius pseudohatsudake]|nr:hypothetical protein EDB85DRAFT_2181672 [Lactarius pseudohatsudake]
MSSQTDAPTSTPTKPVTRFPTLEEGLAIRTLHEATLQELINARNYPLLHIIRERNELMRERNVLRGTDTEFPEYDYTTPLGEECTLPYMAMWVDNECRVLPFRGVRPRNPWAVYPIDRRRFDASTQTEDSDADTTLAEIDTSDSKSHSEAQVVLDDPQAVDRRQFDPNTQTKDTDMTLAQNDLSDPNMQAQYKCISQVGTSPKTPLTHVGGHVDGNTCLAGMPVPPLLWLASHGQFQSSIYASDPPIETYAALFYAQPEDIHDSELEWAPAPDRGSSGRSTPSSTTLIGGNYKPLHNGTATSAAEPGTAVRSSSSQSAHCWGYIQGLFPLGHTLATTASSSTLRTSFP